MIFTIYLGMVPILNVLLSGRNMFLLKNNKNCPSIIPVTPSYLEHCNQYQLSFLNTFKIST